MSRCVEILRRILFEMLPLLGVWTAQRRLQKKINKLETDEGAPESVNEGYGDWFLLGVPKLDELLQSEDARAKKLEEKAGKITVVIAVALTIGSTFAKVVIDGVPDGSVKAIAQGALLVSMAFIVLGGFWALFSGMSAKAQRGYGPTWEVELLRAKATPKRPRVEALVLFELQNIMRNNDIAGALGCVRNGVVFFAIAMVLILLQGPLNGLIQTLFTTALTTGGHTGGGAGGV